MFCTNNSCSTPLHVLLTEAVLYRLGAVATLNSLATRIVQTQLNNSELKPHKFAALSIDNNDISCSHMGFYRATRSWQGPSVQCVQPLPLTGNLTRDDISSTNITTNKRPPVNTPVPREESAANPN